MGCVMTMDDDLDLEADNADNEAYARLEDEMAEPDPSDSLSGASQDDDSGAPAEYGRSEPSADDDEVERASLQAEEWLYEQRSRQGQEYQERPSVYDDPLTHLQEVQAELQVQRSQREYQQFMNQVSEHENVFASITPDYSQAVEHLEKARRSELAKLYPDRSPAAHVAARQHGFANPEQLRNAIFINDAQTVARQALASGRNPAQVYYELAADRGYQSRGSRSGGRSSGSRSSGRSSGNPNVARLTDLYVEDPAAFDREWDKMAKKGALG